VEVSGLATIMRKRNTGKLHVSCTPVEVGLGGGGLSHAALPSPVSKTATNAGTVSVIWRAKKFSAGLDCDDVCRRRTPVAEKGNEKVELCPTGR
jgi:hypothetical protein